MVTRERAMAYAALTRIYMSAILGFAALCGWHLSHGGLAHWKIALVFVSQCCVFASGFALNDLLDKDRDGSVACKPIPTRKLTYAQALRAMLLLCIVGLVTSASLGSVPLGLACGQLVVVYFYSRIKMWSGLGANLATAGLCASSFVFGATVGHGLRGALVPAVLTLEFTVAREVVKDILDQEPDSVAGVPTIPLRYGSRFSARLVALLVISVALTSMLPGVRVAYGAGYTVLMLSVNVILAASTIALLRDSGQHTAGKFLNASAAAFPLALVAFLM